MVLSPLTTLSFEIINLWVGRSGKLTPVCVLSPTLLHGVTVSRATLHNFAMVRSLRIKPGDTVEIRRSGDVIPQVLRVVNAARRRDKTAAEEEEEEEEEEEAAEVAKTKVLKNDIDEKGLVLFTCAS
eukprot:jgi/Bigna1/142586/aug1.71_g17294